MTSAQLGRTSTQDETASSLGTAISLWRTGKRLPRSLAMELSNEGYDVASLERFHFKH